MKIALSAHLLVNVVMTQLSSLLWVFESVEYKIRNDGSVASFTLRGKITNTGDKLRVRVELTPDDEHEQIVLVWVARNEENEWRQVAGRAQTQSAALSRALDKLPG